MADYSGNQKLCATCANWLGSRSIDSFGTWVKDCGSEGKCAITRTGIKTTPANRCACFDWEKWRALK